MSHLLQTMLIRPPEIGILPLKGNGASYRCIHIQRAAKGYVKSFPESSTHQWAVLQLLCSLAREKLQVTYGK